MLRSGDVERELNYLSSEIAKICKNGIVCSKCCYLIGSVITAETIDSILNKSESTPKTEQIVTVYGAFDTPLLHFDSGYHFSTKCNDSNYFYDPSVRVQSYREEYTFDIHST